MSKFTGVLSVWLLCAATSVGALEPKAAAGEPSRTGATQLVPVPGRGGDAPGDLVGNPGKPPQPIQCDAIDGVGSWCTCQGENSPDCDLLFEACDKAGGQWSCGSDLGIDHDGCTCMDW